MDTATGPTVRRYLLGKKLRALREAAGYTAVQAAKHCDLTQPTITRMEKGRNAILVRNVKQLCQLYGIGVPMLDTLVRLARESDGTDWFATYSDTVPDWFGQFASFEAEVAEILSYQSENVPGLLQTADYVRAIRAASGPDIDEDELVRSVDFRLARQKRLDANPPVLRYVLNEAVVRRLVGGREVMRAQLQHLIAMARKDFVTLQLLPFDVGAHPAQLGAFTMLRLPDEPAPNFVFVEHDHGAIYQERPNDLARYQEMFDRLTALALSPEETVKALDSLVGGL